MGEEQGGAGCRVEVCGAVCKKGCRKGGVRGRGREQGMVRVTVEWNAVGMGRAVVMGEFGHPGGP